MRRVVLAWAGGGWLLASAGSSLALDPHKRITQYVHDAWTPRSGAPAGTIRAIAQAPDGYLWLGTASDGLVRFDGIEFARTAELDALFPLRADEVRSLLVTRDGALWVGTSTGLARLKDGHWSLIEDGPSRSVDGMVEMGDGTIAFARQKVGYGFVKNDRVQQFPVGRFDNHHIAVDGDGVVWLGTDGGLMSIRDGRITRFTSADGLGDNYVNALQLDRRRRLWVATRGGLNLIEGGRPLSTRKLSSRNGEGDVNALLDDREGNLWIATAEGGLKRIEAADVQSFRVVSGLTSDNVTALFEDREGALWVGTTGGLDRFRDAAFTPLGVPEGLASNRVASVLEGRDGSLWAFCDGGGLTHIRDGRARTLTVRDGLASDYGGPLFESRDGSLWVGHDRGISRVKDGVVSAFRSGEIGAHYVAAITEDQRSLLVYILDVGLRRFRQGHLEPYLLADGTPLDATMPFMTHWARDGTLWLATISGAVAVRDGHARTVWKAPRSSIATSIHEDADGTIWIGTWHGLVRVRDGRVTVCGPAQGLFHDKIYRVLEDRQGYLWMSCPRGIFRVRKQELEDVALGRSRSARCEPFGILDGLRTAEATGKAPPAGWATRSGRLWFTTAQGLVGVDPERLGRNPLPPPVVIDKVMVDGRPISPGSTLDLPVTAQYLEVHCKGLSLLVPERVHFRFRLEGLDADWVEAGPRHVAYYTNVPPGNRLFRVVASNNDGVWNERGASLLLRMPRRWYRTWWFFAVSALAIALVGGLAHRLRVRQLQARERTLEQRVRERTAALRQEIVERERAQDALRQSEERYELAIRGANEGVWDWDLRSDRIFFSPLWKAILGYGESEIEDRPEEWFARIHPEDVERVRAKLLGYRGGPAALYTDEFRMRHKDGEFRWVLSRGFAVASPEAGCERVVGAMSDVTQRRVYDALTGLANRALFMERIDESLSHARNDAAYHFAVLFIDLDRFKLVNNSLGHLAGDRLLVATGRRIETCLRPSDLVARFGGDEFGVLIDGAVDENETVNVAERIRQAMTEPFDLGGTEDYSTATIGIALSTPHYARADEIVRDADTALHDAKAAGRNRVAIFHSDMRTQVVATLELENALRRALERDELRLHYQPVVSLHTGRVEGFEALVRWQHPERGLLLPQDFIAQAEETRLIVPIGHWVRHEACRQLHVWRATIGAADGISMSVNVSGREFSEPDLAREIRAVLRDSRVPPRHLRVEITETTVMDGDHRIADTLSRLQALKVALDIDDFGTGYSSLSYLQQLPVDALKIDRSFVAKLGPQGENASFIQTMVSLARSLGIPVVAEGVETRAQLRYLRRLGCDRAQGFFFSAPVPVRQAEAFIGATLDIHI